jgi:hypothetical protein
MVFFTIFGLRFVDKISNKVESSLKSLTNSEILPGTLFRKILTAFRQPPVSLTVVMKAACDSEI